MKNAYKKGEIVLVKFPFTDMSDFKVRPALIMRNQDDEDVIILPISTTIKLKKHDLVIKNPHYSGKPLPVPSAIRIGKICTIQTNLIIKKISKLKVEFFRQVQFSLFHYLN